MVYDTRDMVWNTWVYWHLLSYTGTGLKPDGTHTRYGVRGTWCSTRDIVRHTLVLYRLIWRHMSYGIPYAPMMSMIRHI